MKKNLLEQTILYVLVGCAALAIATLARISVVLLKVDNFTAFIVFIIVLGIEIAIYLSIHVVLQGLMFPWIERLLSYLFGLRDRGKVIVAFNGIHKDIIKQEPALTLNDIRNGQLKNKAKEQENKLSVALDYTRETFALHLSDAELEVLSNNVHIYINTFNTDNLLPVAVKELTPLDLRHFGWNIWNFFKPRNQTDIACFLKIVFSNIFQDSEIESIKRHLKDDELKGVIKIRENLLEQ